MKISAKLLLTGLVLASVPRPGLPKEETVEDFLERHSAEGTANNYLLNEAAWLRETDITKAHEEAYIQAHLKASKFWQEMARQANDFLQDGRQRLSRDQRRQLIKIQDIGVSAQTNHTKLTRLTEVTSQMEEIYATAKVCLGSDQDCMNLEPGLTDVLRKSRDCSRLTSAWKGWRDNSGRKMKELYAEYVKLSNDAIEVLGYKDLGDYWKSKYDTATFEDDLVVLLKQIEPLYQHLHAYVRRKLKEVYDPDIFPKTGHIPAHLLGNMWAQSWTNIGEYATPFKGRQSLDVTAEMKRQAYTVMQMFRTAEEFFASLSFANMTDTFWNKSMFVRPEGRQVVCHASAWDMDADDDYRIKMCTVINQEDLMTIHHEMGHIQYYMEYDKQPTAYRDGANPGFHEAVGDTIALSVGTPEHLHTIGLLEKVDNTDTETDINFLMQMALDKIAFLPFAYLIDQWRWGVFRGDTTPGEYNTEWWKLRCRLQGVSPPVQRTSEDFDPGAKYHVPANVGYIRYFVSFVIQFQFYKAACDAAGNTRPLHRCDFYNNREAGEKIRAMLQLGASQPWPEAMEKITGQRKMDAEPLMEYFRPLLEFLERENGQDFGWEDQCPQEVPTCTGGAPGQGVRLSSVLLLVVAAAVFIRNRS